MGEVENAVLDGEMSESQAVEGLLAFSISLYNK